MLIIAVGLFLTAIAVAVMWIFIVIATLYIRWKRQQEREYYLYLNELRKQGKL